jgi:predicted Zn finger-like uncharacterized protein
MAATLVVSCPECKSQITVPAELAGKKIRCKKCGTTFPVKASPPVKPAGKAAAHVAGKGKAAAPPQKKAAAPPPKQEEEDDFEGGKNPYDVTGLDLAPRCPHCAQEMESAEAIVCLNCGYNTLTREHMGVRKTVARGWGQIFRWLLPGIVCVLAICAIIGGDLYFWFGLEDTWKDMDGEEHKYSLGIRVWEVIVSAVVMFFLGKFAFKRLILHPLPPEAEKR